MEEAHFNEEILIIILLHTRGSTLMRTLSLLKSRQSPKQILKTLKEKLKISFEVFHGGRKILDNLSAIINVVPAFLQIRIVDWYHNYLGHPGIQN
jgi:hypothetical protein